MILTYQAFLTDVDLRRRQADFIRMIACGHPTGSRLCCGWCELQNELILAGLYMGHLFHSRIQLQKLQFLHLTGELALSRFLCQIWTSATFYVPEVADYVSEQMLLTQAVQSAHP